MIEFKAVVTGKLVGTEHFKGLNPSAGMVEFIESTQFALYIQSELDDGWEFVQLAIIAPTDYQHELPHLIFKRMT